MVPLQWKQSNALTSVYEWWERTHENVFGRYHCGGVSPLLSLWNTKHAMIFFATNLHKVEICTKGLKLVYPSTYAMQIGKTTLKMAIYSQMQRSTGRSPWFAKPRSNEWSVSRGCNCIANSNRPGLMQQVACCWHVQNHLESTSERSGHEKTQWYSNQRTLLALSVVK